MRIVCISDTHNQHERMKYPLPPGDVLVHAGDMCLAGNIDELEATGEWLRDVGSQYQHVIAIAGNHDWPFIRYPETAQIILRMQVLFIYKTPR